MERKGAVNKPQMNFIENRNLSLKQPLLREVNGEGKVGPFPQNFTSNSRRALPQKTCARVAARGRKFSQSSHLVLGSGKRSMLPFPGPADPPPRCGPSVSLSARSHARAHSRVQGIWGQDWGRTWVGRQKQMSCRGDW